MLYQFQLHLNFPAKKLDTKLFENGTFQSIPNPNDGFLTISNGQDFTICQIRQTEMCILVKSPRNFGEKIQMWFESGQRI